MNNNDILKTRWSYTNLCLKAYLKLYKRINLDTQDEIQSIFNDVKFSFKDLNKPITNIQRNKFIRLVEKWKKEDLLQDYFGYIVASTIAKNIITNKELLQILIWSAYIRERKSLTEIENDLFTNVCKDFYRHAKKDLKPKKNKKLSITWEYIYSLLSIPNVKGSSWNDYVIALALTNTQELERQVLINLQQGKQLKIDDSVFQNIFKKQQNRYLSINDDKFSGSLDSQITELANKSYLKLGEEIGDKKQQVRFIAELDEKTTKMCEGMDNMLFYVNDWNRFYRYSAVDKKDVLYRVKGLEIGVNLPPINNHFHYCRSTITYLIDKPISELKKALAKKYKNVVNKYYKKAKFYDNPISKASKYIDNLGKEYKIKGKDVIYDHSTREEDIAKILTDNFGGNIEIQIKVNNPEGINVPDYKWYNSPFKNEKWDAKGIQGSSSRNIDSKIKNSYKQANSFIIDCNDKKISIENTIEQVEKTLNSRKWIKTIIIINEDKVIGVYENK